MRISAGAGLPAKGCRAITAQSTHAFRDFGSRAARSAGEKAAARPHSTRSIPWARNPRIRSSGTLNFDPSRAKRSALGQVHAQDTVGVLVLDPLRVDAFV